MIIYLSSGYNFARVQAAVGEASLCYIVVSYIHFHWLRCLIQSLLQTSSDWHVTVKLCINLYKLHCHILTHCSDCNLIYSAAVTAGSNWRTTPSNPKVNFIVLTLDTLQLGRLRSRVLTKPRSHEAMAMKAYTLVANGLNNNLWPRLLQSLSLKWAQKKNSPSTMPPYR